jgi:uncharacterized protein
VPLFTLVCQDKPEALDLRLATREAHLAYLRGFGDQVKLAGPLLDTEGRPAGSLLVFEAESLDEAERFAAGDPYAQAGLFEQVDISGFRAVIGGVG